MFQNAINPIGWQIYYTNAADMQRVYENIYLKSFFLPSKAYLTKQT
jgi:hypothetical protein